MSQKERYFTPQSIEQQAGELLQLLPRSYRKKGAAYHPRLSALLVLDMQVHFLDPASHAYIPSAPAIVGGIFQLIETYSKLGHPIVFTQHINTLENAGMMGAWWRDLITPGTPFSQITPEIDLSKGTLIQKSQYDAFYQTALEDLLHGWEVTQLVLCGVMTHLCCETTARSAFMHGFEVFFPADGTATYNLEHHKASLLNLSHGFASIVLVRDILAMLRGERED